MPSPSNLYHAFADAVAAAVAQCVVAGSLPAACQDVPIVVEPPRDASHGDLATNAAMVLAKPAGMPPRAIAELLAGTLRGHSDVAAVEIAGPGFINLRLRDGFWQAQPLAVVAAGADYGRSLMGAGAPVNVEYVSANPTGPMHVGHCRGAVVGDAMARLLAFAGFAVTREYYINDAGGQVDTLARSAHLRYREALGETIGEIPEGLYPGDYLVPVGQALAATFGDTYAKAREEAWLALFKRETTTRMMALIRADLAAMDIAHDVFSSEQALHDSGRVKATLDDLTARGLVYTGVLEKPKGETADDWEPRPQLLFRATQFGDDSDRALQKSDGSYTYFAADIAYHWDKVQRGFIQMVDIFGADHGGYVKRMKAAAKASGGDLDIQLVQMVRLFRAGEPVKMSKRAGTFVTLRDVVDEVGKDVVRFMMLTRKSDSQLDFDFAKVREQSRENPVFYVHYAHARIRSVLRKASEIIPNVSETISGLTPDAMKHLTAPEELGLIRLATQWPRVVETAAQAHEPHRVAFYLYDLAGAFHALWNRGNDDPGLRFLISGNEALTAARLAMIEAVAQVIRNGLALMGVEPAEEMN
jgi:arginyl-tRNA synthetase